MPEFDWARAVLPETACLIIPAYNEAAWIGGVIASARRFIPAILVVDDGSTDRTAAVAVEHGARVLRLPRNRGKGYALRRAFADRWVARREVVLTMDADGQHDPADIPRLWDAYRCSGADIVVGARAFRRGTMPTHRRWNNRWISWVGSWLCGQRVPDFQCGFRLIRTAVLRALVLETWGYETESELLVRAGRAGFRIVSVPVSTIYNDSSSQVRAGREMLRFTRLFFRLLAYPTGRRLSGAV